MAVNKVIYGGNVVMDITDTTATAPTVLAVSARQGEYITSQVEYRNRIVAVR